jgi:hypothetical protein
MSDQCQHCTVRGDFDMCLKTECFHHENWISDQWRAEVARLKAEKAVLADEFEHYILHMDLRRARAAIAKAKA